MPVDLRIDTEGNPETKTVEITGTETPFSVETFGRPKPGGVRIDPGNVILKGNNSLRSRAAIARGEELGPARSVTGGSRAAGRVSPHPIQES